MNRRRCQKFITREAIQPDDGIHLDLPRDFKSPFFYREYIPYEVPAKQNAKFSIGRFDG